MTAIDTAYNYYLSTMESNLLPVMIRIKKANCAIYIIRL